MVQISSSINIIPQLGSLTLATASKGIIVTSPNGSKYKLTVDNAGTLASTLQS